MKGCKPGVSAFLLALVLAGTSAPVAFSLPLEKTLTGLRAVSQQPLIDGWRVHLGDLPGAAAIDLDESGWTRGKPDARGNILWPKGHQVLWMRQRITVPVDWHGYASANTRLDLNLIWWAEKAEIYVNGRFVQAGDLYDAVQRVLLTRSARPGESFVVALKLTSPGHDQGALGQSRLDVQAPQGRTDPGQLADELAIAHGYLQETATATERKQGQSALGTALAAIDWRALRTGKQARFDRSLGAARQRLLPVGRITGKRTIGVLGHSHIDMAWLWPVSETHVQIEKTFRSTLALMEDFPMLNFAQSTAQSYLWMEEEQPRLFEQIQQAAQAGRWEPVGGMWVEPDLNLPDGESLIRQILYGKRYFQDRFGKDIRIGWNPDSFGYTWQLPQIYKKAGIDFFLTTKLDWNDTTKFPYKIFWWQAPDGSKILSYFSNPLGEQIDGVKMAAKARAYERNSGYQKLLWLYGVGDHGGGPTRDMLETAKRWQASPIFPKLEAMSAGQFFAGLAEADRLRPFPVWNSELYLEFHRGTYTTHADQKRQNRRTEVLLANLEKFSAANSLLTGAAYPQEPIERWWKSTLFNQFHDILPGSAIPEVYAQANRERRMVTEGAEAALADALGSLAGRADTRGVGTPVVVFNSLGKLRDSPVLIPAKNLPPGDLVAVDRQGTVAPVQQTADGNRVFWAKAVPGLGYKVFWLRQIPRSPSAPLLEGLENRFVRVELDPVTGNIRSLRDLQARRETLSGPGNQLQFFKDEGQYWDAWNIDPQYEKHPLPGAALVSIEPMESGPVRSVTRVTRRFNRSTFVQDLILYRDTPVLYVDNRVDWQERHVLVKAAFEVNLHTTTASYEIPMATIDRSLKRDTPARKAQWEVPALRWASVSDGALGVSLLNDCKYGYDAKQTRDGTLLRLSLLRGPQWPDPGADLGMQEFTYGFYPHRGNWREGDAVGEGLALNTPLLPAIETPHPGNLPERFLSSDDPRLVLTTWKRAENGDGWIVRLYESTGNWTNAQLVFAQPVVAIEEADLLERPIRSLSPAGSELNIKLGPYEIQTLHLQF